MTAPELRASFGLSGVYGLRMFGLFVILPVFGLYAETLPGGSDRFWVGVAMGAYGITQAVLQIPFGRLSDRWGRKPTIYLGLLLFALGSLVAALATDIFGVIAGRLLQGAGAISAAVIALTADLTRESVRTKAMAFIGISIGVTFSISLVCAPILNRWIGVPGIFMLTGVLALGAIVFVRYAIPDAPPAPVRPKVGTSITEVLSDPQLLRLDVGIFALHAVLMALFMVVPFALRDAGLQASTHWQVYLPVMLGAIVLMLPLMFWSERRRHYKGGLLVAIALLALAQCVMAFLAASVSVLIVGLLLFFVAFNMLEAALPSLISKVAPSNSKGTAIGVYASMQFLGAATGSAVAGWLSKHYGAESVFLFCLALTVVWLIASLSLSIPVARVYPVPNMDNGRAEGLSERLREVSGVRDAWIAVSEGVAHLKVDSASFDEQNVKRLLSGEI